MRSIASIFMIAPFAFAFSSALSMAGQASPLLEQHVGELGRVLYDPASSRIAFQSCKRGVWEHSGNVWMEVEPRQCAIFESIGGEIKQRIADEYDWELEALLTDGSLVATRNVMRKPTDQLVDPWLCRVTSAGTVSPLAEYVPARTLRPFVVSPDQTRLLESRMVGYFTYALHIWDLGTGAVTSLEPALGNSYAGQWSNDSEHVYFRRESDGNLVRAALDGSDLTVLTSFDRDPMLAGSEVNVVSHDETFVVSLKSSDSMPPKIGLWIIPVDGSTPHIVPGSDDVTTGTQFLISPDDKKVAFTTRDPKSYAGIIHIYDRTTGLTTQLTPKAVTLRPDLDAWSADGKQILSRNVKELDDPNAAQLDLVWIDVDTNAVAFITH